jgi:hypothetical protein
MIPWLSFVVWFLNVGIATCIEAIARVDASVLSTRWGDARMHPQQVATSISS